MSEIPETRTAQPTLEELRLNLEREKVIATGVLLRRVLEFTEIDGRFTTQVAELMEILVANIKKNPDAFFRRDKGNVDELVDAMMKKRTEGGTAVAGGDIAGADWIDDLGHLVDVLGSVVTREKDFFLQIIKLIFCGC